MPNKHHKKILLFMGVDINDPKYQQIQGDIQSSYSITFYTISLIMYKEIINFIPNPKIIIDGTASIGVGDIKIFREKFENAKVYAIEYDKTRFNMLQHNINVLGLNINCKNGSVTDLVPEIANNAEYYNRDDVLLLIDPPWGGIEYIEKEKIKVFLSDNHFAIDCANLFKYAKIIALKLPINFDLEDFKANLPSYININIIKNPEIKKQLFIILN